MINVLYKNKDKNAHRYGVRGKKIKREIETPLETHSGDGNEKGGTKRSTRNYNQKMLSSILLH